MATGKKYHTEPIEIKSWLNDDKLSMCSPATRGIWIDMICIMSLNGRTGKLSGTVAQLARLCRCTAEEMQSAIDELESTKTADVTLVTKSNKNLTGQVTLINRRMHSDHNQRNKTKLRVQRHRQKRQCNAQGNTAETTHIQYPVSSIHPPLTPPGDDEEDFEGEVLGENGDLDRLANAYREAFAHEMPAAWQAAVAKESDTALLEQITPEDFVNAHKAFDGNSRMKIWAWGCVRLYVQQKLAKRATKASSQQAGVYPVEPAQPATQDPGANEIDQAVAEFRKLPALEQQQWLSQVRFKLKNKKINERTAAMAWMNSEQKGRIR